MLTKSGLTESVLPQIDGAVKDYALIKIRTSVIYHEVRNELIAEISTIMNSEVVQTIWQGAAFFIKQHQRLTQYCPTYLANVIVEIS